MKGGVERNKSAPTGGERYLGEREKKLRRIWRTGAFERIFPARAKGNWDPQPTKPQASLCLQAFPRQQATRTLGSLRPNLASPSGGLQLLPRGPFRGGQQRQVATQWHSSGLRGGSRWTNPAPILACESQAGCKMRCRFTPIFCRAPRPRPALGTATGCFCLD